MKTHIKRLSALVLILTLLITVVAPLYVNAEEVTIYQNGEYRMYKDGDFYRFTGVTGDASFEIPENAKVISSLDEYYKEKTNSKKDIVVTGTNPLPKSVDLSQTKYFPPVGDQKSLGSCATFSCVYYQFTYAVNKNRNITTTYENTLSPQLPFNFVNAAGTMGTTPEENYGFLEEIGAPTMSTLPYSDADQLSWHAREDVWRDASRARLKDYTFYDDIGKDDKIITSPDDSDLDVLKTALNDGNIIGYSTYVSSWKATKLKKNPSVPENDKFEGEYSVIYNDGFNGPHRMAIVGYNDEIWTDINNNDYVDKGEMGAFKIVNSWGESYYNKGFVWVAYDALNYNSTVKGVNKPYSMSLCNVFSTLNAREYNDKTDIYLKYTLNTAKRAQHTVEVLAEKDGTITKRKLFSYASYQNTDNEGGFDGTQAATDGTFVLCLDTVIKELDASNFEDYSWSVKFTDDTADSNSLIVKNIEIVNESTNKTYKTITSLPHSIDGDSYEFLVKDTTTTKNKVIYYTGYYDANLHYKNVDGTFTKVKMENNTERKNYVSKYVIENAPETTTLYFSDDQGNVDNNSGKYYKATERISYFTTQNVCDELKINDFCFSNGELDTGKRMTFDIDTTGGYAPYLYQITCEDLTTGKSNFYSYKYLEYMDYFSYVFRTLGKYKITIETTDHTGKQASFTKVIETLDLPFEFVELKATEVFKFVGENIHFFAKSQNEGVFSHGLEKSNYDFVIKDENGNICYSINKLGDVSNISEKYSESSLDYIPTKAGKYTITVSATDVNKDYAEISLDFLVIDKTIGDADGNADVNIMDATTIQQYLANIINEENIYTDMADCDDNTDVNIMDATRIQLYLAKKENSGSVGNVVEFIPPTEPPTQAPTVAPTQKPTEAPKSNKVTFTNSLNWSGTIYCYYWSDENTAMTSWPGKAMTNSGTNEFSQTLYTFDVPSGASYIIFTNGSSQTVDIKYNGGEVKYYALNTKTGNGFNVETW